MKPIAFSVIGGFLGSGKTTLINHILASKTQTRFAVLVNDFGALNIDKSLIESFDGTLMQLANGCICCSLAGGLIEAMLTLMQQADQIEHILIEASGVSNPSRIMDFARIDDDLLPCKTIVLIDCLHFTMHLADSTLYETMQDQLASADIFLITKSESCAPKAIEEIQAILSKRAKTIPQLIVDGSNSVDISYLLGETLERIYPLPTESNLPEHGLKTVSFIAQKVINITHLEDFLSQEVVGVIRAKGRIQTSEGNWIYQQVARQVTVTPCAEQLTQSELVVISQQNIPMIRNALEAEGFQLL